MAKMLPVIGLVIMCVAAYCGGMSVAAKHDFYIIMCLLCFLLGFALFRQKF